ncbi:hypothetical protein BDF19DRAFT_446709 [Syncephalis fuscata]|nr:hypothetical protein BDF19DRAFT_446709 [Syncephalis fuscata]
MTIINSTSVIVLIAVYHLLFIRLPIVKSCLLLSTCKQLVGRLYLAISFLDISLPSQYIPSAKVSDADTDSLTDMSAEFEQRQRIIEPGAHSTGMFVNVRPGPEGYRQRRHRSRGGAAKHNHDGRESSNGSEEPWTEEEREMLAAVMDEMTHKKQSTFTATNGDNGSPQSEGAADITANTSITIGRIGQLPVLMVVLPAVGSLFIGTAQGWGDAVTLVAIGWFLYYVMQIPWDFYESSRLQKQIHVLKRRGKKRLGQLQQWEYIALAMTFIAPLVAAWLLRQLRFQLTALQRISPSSALLYVLVALIRPITHVTAILRRRAIRLRRELTWSPHEADRIRLQLADVEEQIAELRLLVIREEDMRVVKDEVLTKIDRAVRQVKMVARNEEQQRHEVVERVATVEDRVAHAEDWLEQQRVQQAQQCLLVRCVFEPVEVLKEVVQMKRAVFGIGAATAIPRLDELNDSDLELEGAITESQSHIAIIDN